MTFLKTTDRLVVSRKTPSTYFWILPQLEMLKVSGKIPPATPGDSRGVGGSALSPKLLTGGIPCTESLPTPQESPSDVPEFSHGGYDGGIEGGVDGTWSPLKFSEVIAKLEAAKELACEVQKGPEGIPLELAGEEVLVMPTGGKVGGLLYKYRFLCRGVEFLVHSNPPKGTLLPQRGQQALAD